MRLGEKADDVGGHVGADPVDVEKVGAGGALRVLRRVHLAPPIGEAAIVPCEQPRGRLADLGDAERVDEAVERDPPALVDRADEVRGAQLAPAFAAGDLVCFQAEDVAGAADQPVLPERGDMLGAHPLDVEIIARDEMLEPPRWACCRTDQAAGTAPCHKTGLADHEAAAPGAFVGELVRLRTGRPSIKDNGNNLRDHVVAGALDHDGIPFPNILSRDLVLVMQSGALNDHAAHGNRSEKRDRRQRAHAADLDVDLFAVTVSRLLRRKFMGERPARRPADHAQPLLQGQIVDLVDDTVDVVGQRRPGRRRSRGRRRAPRRRRGRGASAGSTVNPQSRKCRSASAWLLANGVLASPQA